MLSIKNLFLAAGLLGLSFAGPLDTRQGSDPSCNICIDNANKCGKMYGGCWNFCDNYQKTFDIPPCKGNKGKKQVCEYFKNGCGKVFGGCYPAEGPIPLWEEPQCNIDKREMKAADGPGGDGERVCEWFKNECGKKYGGCYPASGPIPLFAVPSCP